MSSELRTMPDPGGDHGAGGSDEALLGKIVALLRTLPFAGSGESDEQEEDRSTERVERRFCDRTVHPLRPSEDDEAICICRNLTTIARAFARLSDEDLYTVPAEVRERARGELIGVWKTLDLARRVEVSQSLFASGV